MNPDARLDQFFQVGKHRRAFQAQEPAAHCWIRGMNGNVQWRKAQPDDPFEIAPGQPHQRQVIAEEKGKTVVLILQV
ncbi:MAG TPA: hypothetical protein ENF16_04620 [Bacteroidetes bacterium]|nr:hypothetical protein [Bacteroidota bacterium]